LARERSGSAAATTAAGVSWEGTIMGVLVVVVVVMMAVEYVMVGWKRRRRRRRGRTVVVRAAWVAARYHIFVVVLSEGTLSKRRQA